MWKKIERALRVKSKIFKRTKRSSRLSEQFTKKSTCFSGDVKLNVIQKGVHWLSDFSA